MPVCSVPHCFEGTGVEAQHLRLLKSYKRAGSWCQRPPWSNKASRQSASEKPFRQQNLPEGAKRGAPSPGGRSLSVVVH
jgi:hypothetical protein